MALDSRHAYHFQKMRLWLRRISGQDEEKSNVVSYISFIDWRMINRTPPMGEISRLLSPMNMRRFILYARLNNALFPGEGGRFSHANSH